MTSLLWRTSYSKNVAEVPLVPQSAHNLALCLENVVKAGAVSASSHESLNIQEQVSIR